MRFLYGFVLSHPQWKLFDNVIYVITCIIVCAYCIKHWNDTRR